MSVKEADFEATIEASLLSARGGYIKGDPSRFDPVAGLDVDMLVGFVQDTQEKAWDQLVKRSGGEADATTALAKGITAACDKVGGTVDVLRHGVVVSGIDIRVAYFRPAHGLTPELQRRYEANRLTVTRQLPFEADSNKTLDLVLSVNGIPVATAELKNPLTHQDVNNAMTQYRSDRDPNNTTLARRAVVHFAVDPYLVLMTTRLAGQATRFLPFNRGDHGGAGNPASKGGYPAGYLWEEVWRRDAWMDILARFIHIETPASGSKAEKAKAATLIFPRFHQWDAVLNLEAAAGGDGPGHSYLVQHSAGSGKSNTIGWLAHRLANLHTGDDVKVFDKVVVITDRRVLDRQLQDTIYQFEHAWGVVEKVDRDSTQLAEALEGEQAKIIITTLQKFPFVLDKIESLPARSYAVIIDEAHSSQGGEAAKDLKVVLGVSAEEQLAAASEAEAATDEPLTGEDEVIAEVEGRGRQTNLSFFAFTATPKAKTLELFGALTETPTGDRYEPFHLYSMRQAIEEGFILDVLANYTTYRTFFHIEKAVPSDPEYDPAKAKAAIARFVTLHPHNLAQHAEIVVNHFRRHTSPKIRGHAKAMVVTSSRLHAVRFAQALTKYVADEHIDDIGVLVAFSGTVRVNGEEYTEANMNGFPESETARRFDTDAYRILVVAEKFQTGFDQPLLHTMYVDKKLEGLNAVQTLSRLNRIHPDKTDTFVLDFRNDTDIIETAFAPYYERTAAIPTEPHLMWDTKAEVAAYPVIYETEIDGVVAALREDKSATHRKVTAALEPARGRFEALPEDEQDQFRDALKRFLNLYSFLSQVVDYTDQRLDDWYVYGRALEAVLPRRDRGTIDLSSEVELTHLRIRKQSEGGLDLPEGGGDVTAVFGGHGRLHDPDDETLSTIIDQINQRFGLELTEQDKLLFDQYEQSWLEDDHLGDQARNNDLGNFRLVFDRVFLDTVVRRMDANEEIFKKILDDRTFRSYLLDYYVGRVYQGHREGI